MREDRTGGRKRLQREGRAGKEERQHDAHMDSRDARDAKGGRAQQTHDAGRRRTQHQAVQRQAGVVRPPQRRPARQEGAPPEHTSRESLVARLDAPWHLSK